MARGSRYKNERLVGPGNIDQLSYFDVAKAHLHIDGIIPVPSRTNVLTTENGLTQPFPVDIGPGALMRIIMDTTGGTLVFGRHIDDPSFTIDAITAADGSARTIAVSDTSIYAIGDLLTLDNNDQFIVSDVVSSALTIEFVRPATVFPTTTNTIESKADFSAADDDYQTHLLATESSFTVIPATIETSDGAELIPSSYRIQQGSPSVIATVTAIEFTRDD